MTMVALKIAGTLGDEDVTEQGAEGGGVGKRSSRGTSTVEYALLVAALAGGTAAVTMTGLGPAVQGVFQHLVDQFGSHTQNPDPGGGTDPGSGGGSTGSSPSPSPSPSPSDIPVPTP